MGDITQRVRRAREGDAAALDALFAQLYPELRRLPHARLAGGGRLTLLDTTSLVHECYLQFVNAGFACRTWGERA